jgi:hypothetical protein
MELDINDIGNVLLIFFGGLVVLSFFISFFCCAPSFGPVDREQLRDEERDPLLPQTTT